MSKKESEKAINYLIKEMGNEYRELIDTNNISDGYHTFGELYNHRHALFINLTKQYKKDSFKTWKDNKGKTIEGWFILGINTKYGQITYHLPDNYWHFCKDINEVERNSNYDGHTSSDVYDRLLKLLWNNHD